MLEPTLLLHFIQLAVSGLLCGLIWTVQIVHYPSLAFVNPESFKAAHSFHSRRISLLVIPLMLLELISAGVLVVVYHENTFLTWFAWVNLLSILLIWISTFLLSVPLHVELSQGYNAKTLSKLVTSNWPRTILWSIRFIAWIWLIAHSYI